ncbi:hypothetical protein BDR07DRAFT_1407687 [Suillus spraguei]|nr:hypothetical protein BDR07DRAFT_1407687 [Suillus spraguei]
MVYKPHTKEAPRYHIQPRNFTSSKQAQVITMQSQSQRSHHASPYKVENAPRNRCMTREQLDILEPYYAKKTHPTKYETELIAQVLNMPFMKVANWFGNRRSKDARAQRSSEWAMTELLGNMHIDHTDYVTDADYDDGHQSRYAQGAPYRAGLDQEALYQAARAHVARMAGMSPQEVDMETRHARACVLAMADMKPEEVDAAFILNNFKRRIIVHAPNK